MRKLTVFNHVSLDGYFTDASGGVGWLHRDESDAEWDEFVQQNAASGGDLVFGRKTYELMASWWPTPQAQKSDPIVAERMNALRKYVFSRTLGQADWSNTTLLHLDPAAELARLKGEPGNDLVVMGSGSIVAQLAPSGLIDAYQIVVNPIVLGKGRTLWSGLVEPISLRRSEFREFQNGNVLLTLVPLG
jgi:dihydrofolate reductase